jgi:hypothetical protein
MRGLVFFLLSVMLFSQPAQAQSEGKLLPLFIVGNDTFPTCTLAEVVVVSKRQFKDQVAQYQYNRLKQNIIAVYPYAKEAGAIFRELNDELSILNTKREKKRFMKLKEKELDALYESSLKNLTVTQGDLLVKLIARETGLTVFELIEEFKNPMSAFYWNKLSGLYGYSLKQEYDPQEQRDIEMIMRSIEGDL